METFILTRGVNDQAAWASWTKLGNTWRALGNPFKAIQSFRKALALKGSADPDILLNVALVLRHAGELADAVTAIDRAVALSPKGVLYLYIRGEILTEVGRYDDALEDYDTALIISPKFLAASVSTPLRLQSREGPLSAQADNYQPDNYQPVVRRGPGAQHRTRHAAAEALRQSWQAAPHAQHRGTTAERAPRTQIAQGWPNRDQSSGLE